MRSTWRRTDCIVVVLEFIFCWALHPNEYLNLGPSFGAKKRKKNERERTTDTRQKTRLNFGEEAVTAEAHDFVGHVRSITGRWQNNNQEIVGSSSSHTRLEIF
jgi:hypothetical protein